jgi:hypothetical protein
MAESDARDLISIHRQASPIGAGLRAELGLANYEVSRWRRMGGRRSIALSLWRGLLMKTSSAKKTPASSEAGALSQRPFQNYLDGL